MAAILAASAYAACPTGISPKFCGDFTEVNDLVAASSGDYTWQFAAGVPFTNDGFEVKLFRFLADQVGAQVPDQWTKDPILFLPPDREDCTYWLKVEDDTADSIPKQLFDAGYDVYLGCKRGSSFNKGNDTWYQYESWWQLKNLA